MVLIASTRRRRTAWTVCLVVCAFLLLYSIRRPLVEFSRNGLFWQWLTACLIAGCVKVMVGFARERRFNFRWIIGTGGMPSSHAAGVAALSTGVGRSYGFDSVYFAIALVFTLITLFDAQGVRRSSGRQARILNRMLEDLSLHRPIQEDRLNELLGHTPVEVIVGVGIGILTSLVLS